MEIDGHGAETYLFLNGISTSTEILLHDNVFLVPVTAELDRGIVSSLFQNDVDYAAAILYERTIASQIRVQAADEIELACTAWNAIWDGMLLGALFHCEVMANIICDKPVEQLKNAKEMHITNQAFHAIQSEPYQLTSTDVEWIGNYYSAAYGLINKDAFMTATHAMASYKWHSVLRVQLAIIWSGIEALFEASTEISFRISLYIANFLAGDDIEKAKELFTQTRKLYSSRSAAVHGGKIKGDIDDLVSQSALLLNRIIRRCAELGGLPNVNDLVFPSFCKTDNTNCSI